MEFNPVLHKRLTYGIARTPFRTSHAAASGTQRRPAALTCSRSKRDSPALGPGEEDVPPGGMAAPGHGVGPPLRQSTTGRRRSAPRGPLSAAGQPAGRGGKGRPPQVCCRTAPSGLAALPRTCRSPSGGRAAGPALLGEPVGKAAARGPVCGERREGSAPAARRRGKGKEEENGGEPPYLSDPAGRAAPPPAAPRHPDSSRRAPRADTPRRLAERRVSSGWGRCSHGARGDSPHGHKSASSWLMLTTSGWRSPALFSWGGVMRRRWESLRHGTISGRSTAQIQIELWKAPSSPGYRQALSTATDTVFPIKAACWPSLFVTEQYRCTWDLIPTQRSAVYIGPLNTESNFFRQRAIGLVLNWERVDLVRC